MNDGLFVVYITFCIRVHLYLVFIMQRFSFSNNLGITRFMGIINISEDSFYENSRCHSIDEVFLAADKMISEGADFLDVGAESTRPGSKPITEEEKV